MNNGLLEYALYDDKGARQNVVPPDIAADHTIPRPFTKNLQPMISCVRCHSEAKGDDGWKPLVNNVRDLQKKGLNLFGHNSINDADNLDRLSGLYSGDLTKVLIRARDDLSEAHVRLTKKDTETNALSLSKIWSDYNWDMVTPERAAKEAGVKDIKDILPNPVDINTGISPEDPYLGALQRDTKITRKDWEQIFPDVMTHKEIKK
jgi:hypothetical protein